MLTEQEEGKVRNIIDAFDNGKSVTELNAATTLGNNDVVEVLQGGIVTGKQIGRAHV